MAAVVLEGLSKVFRGPGGEDIHAVRRLDLSVDDGELVVLLGPSGCGKSTTLRLIAGLETPTAGRIVIGGRPAERLPPREREVAMVFQSHALYPHMSAFENMAFGLRGKVPGSEARRRVREVAEALRLSPLLDRRPAALSGGERGRVALGRALVRRPRVFLLDEPLSGLDARLRAELRLEIATLRRRIEVPMLYVTHDQTEAMMLGDRVAVLREGALEQAAAPETIYDRPATRWVGEFIGSPPMNCVEGILDRAGEDLFFEERGRGGERGFRIGLERPASRPLLGLAGRDVVLGLRPEALRVAGEVEGPAPGRAIRARVDLVETLGHEARIHLFTGFHSLVMRGRSSGIRPATEIDVVVMTEGARFFDPATGKAL